MFGVLETVYGENICLFDVGILRFWAVVEWRYFVVAKYLRKIFPMGYEIHGVPEPNIAAYLVLPSMLVHLADAQRRRRMRNNSTSPHAKS